MKYILTFGDEKFEVTEEDKVKIEQAVDEDMKFVQLSSGRTIDPLMVKEFKPVSENIEWFSIDDFDYGEAHKKMMIKRVQERKEMFAKYVANKDRLDRIKKQAERAEEPQKDILREEYRKVKEEMREWESLIAGVKKKDKRKTITRQYSPYTKNGETYYRLLEFNNKSRTVRIVSESTVKPNGWDEKYSYMVVN